LPQNFSPYRFVAEIFAQLVYIPRSIFNASGINDD
jgi:hypothetical protein